VVCDEFHKLSEGLKADEVARARAQIKASVLMARESSLSRCERLAHQILVFGRPLPTEEIIDRIEAVDEAALLRLSGRLMGSRPTLAALGPLGRVEPFERLSARLAARPG
jgi:predicted Zn-dependent peptidase